MTAAEIAAEPILGELQSTSSAILGTTKCHVTIHLTNLPMCFKTMTELSRSYRYHARHCGRK